jgi:membrane protease YdiL (CAAX protease family)
MNGDSQEAIHTITKYAQEITRGSYKNADELFRMTDKTKYSPEIADLSEAFGMMSVKVEAREFALQQKNTELEESLKLRSLASGLLLWFSLGISLFIFILAFFYEPGFMDPLKPVLVRWFGTVFILGQVVLMTLLIRKSGFPLSAFGLTWQNARKSVKESLVTSAIFIVGLILLKIWLINSDSVLHGKPLIAQEEFKTLFLYLFFISAPLQEFLIRGVLQSSAERIIMGRQKVFWSIVSISMIFSALHTIYSLPFALLTFFVSLLWGWLYARHHTLIGVSICHLLLGLAFILLGFWEIIAF